MEDTILHQRDVEAVIDRRIAEALGGGGGSGSAVAGWKSLSYSGADDRAVHALVYDGGQWGPGGLADFTVLDPDEGSEQFVVIPAGIWLCTWVTAIFDGGVFPVVETSLNVFNDDSANQRWDGSIFEEIVPPALELTSTVYLKSAGTLGLSPHIGQNTVAGTITLSFIKLG